MKLKFDDRDDRHEWWLNGKRASGISGLGEAIDNTYNLEQWSLRMTMLGTALRPDIAEMALAHHDDKKQLGRLVEQAKNHAKANEGANRGTAKHRISERIDLGEDTLLSPTMEQFRSAYLQGLADHGLTVIPEYVERAVVWPDESWCGMYDRIYGFTKPCPTCKGTKRIADLKSGENAVAYPHSIAVQLTGYAYAPHTAVMSETRNQVWEATDFNPHPDDLCRCKGIIIHAPADGLVGVWEIDLQPEMLNLVRQVKAWQKVKATALVRPYSAPAKPTPYVVPVVAAEPVWRAVMADETEQVADLTLVARIRLGYERRPEPAKTVIGMLLKQAKEAHVPFGSLDTYPTVRRFELARAAFAIADHADGEDELTRAAMACVIGDVPPAPLGAVLGTFTPAEARQLCLVLEGVAAGTRVADYSSGALRLISNPKGTAA